MQFPFSALPAAFELAGRHRRLAIEWTLLIAAQLLVAIAIAVVLLHEHGDVQQAEVARLQGQARVIDENLSQQLDGANKALIGMAAEIGRAGADVSPARVTSQLKLLTAAMPGASSMVWLGPDGTVLATTRDGLAGKNFVQRDYFYTPRRVGDPDRLYVSPPFHTTVGTYVIVTSRIVLDEKGEFAGVVTATLSPEYFAVLLRSVLYAPDMRAALLHQDGAVFLDMAEASSSPAQESNGLAAVVAEERHKGVASNVSHVVSRIGGTPRLIELRSLDAGKLNRDRPLIAAVSRSLDVIFANWRDRAWQASGMFTFLVLVSAGSLWLDQRRRREAFAASFAAQRALQVAADRIEQALRGADLGLWELHVPTNTFVINARERALLGYGPDEELPQGPAWRLLVHPDDRATVDAAIVPHLNGKAPTYDCEHRMLHRGGHYVWVSSRAMIVARSSKGVPLRIVGTHLDVTARKVAEAKQLLTERRLRAINDNVPAIVAHLDRDSRYLTANEGFRRVFGLDPAAMLGRKLREIRGEYVYTQMAHHLEAVLRGETRRFELTDVVDGLQHHFQHSFAPDIDEQGAVQGYYSVSFDITDLRRSERLLMESSARHRAIVEEQSELVSLARQDGQVVYVNPAHAKHFGVSPDALADVNLFDLVAPADRAMARAVIADVFATGQSRSGDSRVFTTDGSERWVAWTNTMQHDSEGSVLLRSVGRDITEQRRAERALRASQRFLSRTGRVAGVGGWEVDLAHGTLTWSEQVQRIHEVPESYVPSVEGAIAFYAPEAQPVIREAVQRAIDACESMDLELPLVTATGRRIWVRAVGDVETLDGKPVRLVGAFQDITVRKLAEQAVEQKERLLRLVADNLPVFIMYVDTSEIVRFVNATGEQWLGCAPGTGLDRPLEEVLGPVRYESRRAQVQQALAGETVQFEIETQVQGRQRHLQQIYTPDVRPDGTIAGLFTLITDITSAKDVQRRLEEQARVDVLTGLPNRRQFDEKLAEALRRSHRNLQHVAVMYLDIDHFKSINDSLGHAGGDTVLKEFGLRLKASVRETDLAARLGGDEFVVLLEGLTGKDDASAVAQKVVEAMRANFTVNGSALRVTTSMGVGFSSSAATTPDELMASADNALYEAKRGGRDGFRLSNFGELRLVSSQAL